MKPRFLIALAIVAVAAVGGAVAVSTSQDPPEQRAEVGERLYPELAARGEEIRTITVTHKDGSFRIVRDGDRWVVPGKSNYPASIEAVRKVLVGLSELRILEAKTRSADVYPELEVEDVDAPESKSVQVALLDGKGGDVLTVLVGKNRYGRGGTAGDGVYIRKAGDAQAWLAKGRVDVNRQIVGWLDRDVVDIPRERIRTVTVKADDKSLTVMRAKPEDKDFTLKDVPKDRKPKGSYEINAVGGAFESLDLDDVRPAADVAFSPDSPVTEAETFDGLRITASFAQFEDATWARFSAAFEAPKDPVKTEGESKLKSAEDVKKEVEAINARVGGWAYKLPNYKVETLRRKLEDLLEQKKKES